MLTVVGDFPDPFLHLQKMSLFSFFYFASAIKDNHVCTVITIATFIYDCTACMCQCKYKCSFFVFIKKQSHLSCLLPSKLPVQFMWSFAKLAHARKPPAVK